MGDKEKIFVLGCLGGGFDVIGDTKEDLELQQTFRTNVVNVVQDAAENIQVCRNK